MIIEQDIVNDIQERLQYNQYTGVFTWKSQAPRGKSLGDAVGTPHPGGYLQVKLNKKNYYLHRLAWLFVYGKLPEMCIDHVNGDKTDNRIINLRDVSVRRNGQNLSRHRHGDLVGARYNKKTGTYLAQIKINGASRCVGRFPSQEDANKQYLRVCEMVENGEDVSGIISSAYARQNFYGATFNKQKNKWVAQATYGGHQNYLGHFNTEEEASIRAITAKQEWDAAHPENPSPSTRNYFRSLSLLEQLAHG